ncbi:hypothetical protein AJ79_02199 [Helicocarpus griseus UAMH5409]|uniref:Uncharacterized protein n=1 Tax=Helicocarpus griseus UAMH5409 TaxID=1447875 RepID=A0A2B7Y4P1_9EURO|nr:hypothetical protein AJ79_02199 [Helicocarpus griseus UAMH5409]
MAELFVAIYQPVNQTLGTYHWALYLKKTVPTKEHYIFQIIGEPCKFQYDERAADPESSAHHIENIPIAEIDHIDHFREIVRGQKIENEMYNWGCQLWVYDVLESLVDDGLLIDYDHAEAKLKLDTLYGNQVEDNYDF